MVTPASVRFVRLRFQNGALRRRVPAPTACGLILLNTRHDHLADGGVVGGLTAGAVKV